MTRRLLLRWLSFWTAMGFGVLIALFVGVSQGQEPTLKDRLEKGLKARLPEEFTFINTVVTMVENGQLPRDLVDGVFFWVRKNKAHKRYLVPYFERLLRMKALERGIEIP